MVFGILAVFWRNEGMATQTSPNSIRLTSRTQNQALSMIWKFFAKCKIWTVC